MLHRFIPKRERIADYTSDEVMIFVDIINGPPYKWLGYHKDFSPPNLNVAFDRGIQQCTPIMTSAGAYGVSDTLSAPSLLYISVLDRDTRL